MGRGRQVHVLPRGKWPIDRRARIERDDGRADGRNNSSGAECPSSGRKGLKEREGTGRDSKWEIIGTQEMAAAAAE